MDLAAVRAVLPSMTRKALGVVATITPMKEGEMKAVVDPDRAPLTEVPGRFDVDPDLFGMGTGEMRRGEASVGGEKSSISFALSDLQWMPQRSDQVSYVGPQGVETYRIERSGRTIAGSVIFYLSRV